MTCLKIPRILQHITITVMTEKKNLKEFYTSDWFPLSISFSWNSYSDCIKIYIKKNLWNVLASATSDKNNCDSLYFHKNVLKKKMFDLLKDTQNLATHHCNFNEEKIELERILYLWLISTFHILLKFFFRLHQNLHKKEALKCFTRCTQWQK